MTLVKKINDKDSKFKIGDIVRISKYKNIFVKDYVPNWHEDVFVINKVKNTVPWTYLISDLKAEKIVGTFYKKELQKANKKEFIVEKMVKGKEDKPYVKWKGCDNSFNCWIEKKEIKNSYILTKSITSHNKKSLLKSLYTQQKQLSSLTRDCRLPLFTANETLLTSHDLNYPRKNLIYLKQVYTFQSNQIKFENPKSSLPLKRFIVPLLTTLNPRKPKVR